MEEKNIAEKIKDAFRSNFGYIAVVVMSLAFVASSFLSIESTGKEIPRIIADGIITFVVGILVNRMFEMQGVINGDADLRVVDAVKKHSEMVEIVAPHLDLLDEWCAVKNAEALARARRTYLSRHGLRYAEHFDADGIRIPARREGGRGLRARMQRFWVGRRVRHAERLRLTRLSAGLLISDTGDLNDPYFLGRSKQEYGLQSAKHDVWSKVILAVFFGYYGVSLVQDFSPANLIWTIFQLALFLLLGALKMEQSQMFVTDEYRERVNKKTDILQMFHACLRKEEEYEH